MVPAHSLHQHRRRCRSFQFSHRVDGQSPSSGAQSTTGKCPGYRQRRRAAGIDRSQHHRRAHPRVSLRPCNALDVRSLRRNDSGTGQPNNRSTKQPIDQSTDRPVNRSIRLRIDGDRPTNYTTNRSQERNLPTLQGAAKSSRCLLSFQPNTQMRFNIETQRNSQPTQAFPHPTDYILPTGPRSRCWPVQTMGQPSVEHPIAKQIEHMTCQRERASALESNQSIRSANSSTGPGRGTRRQPVRFPKAMPATHASGAKAAWTAGSVHPEHPIRAARFSR